MSQHRIQSQNRIWSQNNTQSTSIQRWCGFFLFDKWPSPLPAFPALLVPRDSFLRKALRLSKTFVVPLKNTVSNSEYLLVDDSPFEKVGSHITTLLIGTFSYRQCLPSRFKKDLVKAAKKDENGQIALVDLQQVIENISMQHKVSEQEMETIFQEMGESGKISADKFMTIIWDGVFWPIIIESQIFIIFARAIEQTRDAGTIFENRNCSDRT